MKFDKFQTKDWAVLCYIDGPSGSPDAKNNKESQIRK
jgi:hypothetical protein